jgi:hypothetical protein
MAARKKHKKGNRQDPATQLSEVARAIQNHKRDLHKGVKHLCDELQKIEKLVSQMPPDSDREKIEALLQQLISEVCGPSNPPWHYSPSCGW